MSDNIPFDIQVEIIKRLPVKSLIQFRSVSKAWKSLIDSSDFILHDSGHHTQVQNLLVSYEDPVDSKQKYISIVDDDTFPQKRVSVPIPLLVNMLKYPTIIGSSHGLCLYSDCVWGSQLCIEMAVVWNISIKKAFAVVVPNVEVGGTFGTVLGFGVCNDTNDPKIVKINHINRWSDIEKFSYIPSQVEVFTLSTGVWRDPYSNLPRESIEFLSYHIAIDRFLYWLAINRISIDGEFSYNNLIISFDITSEEFNEVNLPDSLTNLSNNYHLSICKLRESLVVLEHTLEADIPLSSCASVWMMEDSVLKSFTKIFNINIPHASVRGFRKTGEPIIEIVENGFSKTDSESVFEVVDDACGQLAVYEPCSKHIHNLGIKGTYSNFAVYPYMETLLLFDHPDRTVYNDKETVEFEDDLFEELNFSYVQDKV